MIHLYIYPYNLEGLGDEYICKKLYFKDFYIGMQRDETNLRVVRKITEGSIMLKDPDDFDTLKPYFSASQDAQLYYEDIYHWCRITFIKPNYTSKKVEIILTFIDNYSKLFEGISPLSRSSSAIPLVDKKLSIDEFSYAPSNIFVDASSYMYGDLWGLESVDKTETNRKIPFDDIKLWNIGGDELKLEDLVSGYKYLEQGYIPYWVKYDDKRTAYSQFKRVRTIWKREYKYYPTSENVPTGWEIDSGTQEINGITYQKYYRKIDGDQNKWFTGNHNYFIRDESQASTKYMTAEYEGYSESLQKSRYFYEIKDVITKLFKTHLNLGYLVFDNNSQLYISTMQNLNSEGRYVVKFDMQMFIDMLRDTFGLYFWYDGTNIGFEYNDWFNSKLLDIDNTKGNNWYENIEPLLLDLPNVYKFTSGSLRPDFKDQFVSFAGYSNSPKTISSPIITDLEQNSNSEDSYILINTYNKSHDQIYEQFTYWDQGYVGIEAIFRSMNGKFLSWDSDLLENSSYIWFQLASNPIWTQVNQNIKISFGYVIYEGYVYVECGNRSWGLTGPSYNILTIKEGISYSSSCTFKVEVKDTSNSGARGFLFNIKVETDTKVPNTVTCPITGLSQKNGALSLSNTIKNYQVSMTYTRGYLENYGTIHPKAIFNREIEFRMIIEADIFEDRNVFNKYMSLDDEKYCIFERKRRILTEDKVSEIDHIKARTNEVY